MADASAKRVEIVMRYWTAISYLSATPALLLVTVQSRHLMLSSTCNAHDWTAAHPGESNLSLSEAVYTRNPLCTGTHKKRTAPLLSGFPTGHHGASTPGSISPMETRRRFPYSGQ